MRTKTTTQEHLISPTFCQNQIPISILHHFRSQLCPIISIIDLMKAGKELDSQSEECIAVIDAAAKEMLKFTDDLMAMNKSETKNITINNRPEILFKRNKKATQPKFPI